jgi:hypothetical protein
MDSFNQMAREVPAFAGLDVGVETGGHWGAAHEALTPKTTMDWSIQSSSALVKIKVAVFRCRDDHGRVRRPGGAQGERLHPGPRWPEPDCAASSPSYIPVLGRC